MTIYSINNSGKRQYVAHFANAITGQIFIQQMRKVYEGHLFEMEFE